MSGGAAASTRYLRLSGSDVLKQRSGSREVQQGHAVARGLSR